MTSVPSRGRSLCTGATGGAGCPKPATRPHPVRRGLAWRSSRRPDGDAGALGLTLLVEHGSLPQEGGELARAGNGDDPCRLTAREREIAPAAVQTSLRTPGDGADTGILSGLATDEPLIKARLVTVVVCGLDEQPSCV